LPAFPDPAAREIIAVLSPERKEPSKLICCIDFKTMSPPFPTPDADLESDDNRELRKIMFPLFVTISIFPADARSDRDEEYSSVYFSDTSPLLAFTSMSLAEPIPEELELMKILFKSMAVVPLIPMPSAIKVTIPASPSLAV
jgi:hypothetical protein